MVETKLAYNFNTCESRRVVVGQAIDYVSELQLLSVDDINERSHGKLDQALLALADGEKDEPYRRLKKALAENLKAREFRIVVAVDVPSPELARMVNALSTCYDILHLCVSKHWDPATEETSYHSRLQIFDAQTYTARQRGRRTGTSTYLVEVIDDFDLLVPIGFRAFAAVALIAQAKALLLISEGL